MEIFCLFVTSYGSGSASQKIMVPTVTVLQHWWKTLKNLPCKNATLQMYAESRETGLLELLIQLPKNVKMYQIRAPVPF